MWSGPGRCSGAPAGASSAVTRTRALGCTGTLFNAAVSGEKVAKSLKKTAIRLMLKVGINWHDGAFEDQVGVRRFARRNPALR